MQKSLTKYQQTNSKRSDTIIKWDLSLGCQDGSIKAIYDKSTAVITLNDEKVKVFL